MPRPRTRRTVIALYGPGLKLCPVCGFYFAHIPVETGIRCRWADRTYCSAGCRTSAARSRKNAEAEAG